MLNDKPKLKKECMICTTEIRTDIGNGKIKKNQEYNEVTVELSNDSLMKIGVCSRHAHLGNHDLEQITDKMRRGWLEEVRFGIGSREWVNKIGINLKAIGVVE